MNSKPLKTAYELRDIIVEQASAFLGSWPAGMTLFIFDDAYGWNASISRPASEADNFYRTRALDMIGTLRKTYDLDMLHVPVDRSDLRFSNPAFDLRQSRPPGSSTWQEARKEALGKLRGPRKRKSR